MKCPKCQAENPDDARFCIACGSPAEVQCPKCGALTPARGRFCKDCAHDLKEIKPTPQARYSQPQTYTPKFLADKIMKARQSIEGERKLVTVLFADVAGYTSMSEKLDPEEVHQIMDRCFQIIMDQIHRYEGSITQFTGDGAMALFGAPVAHEDHAQRACYAALAIQNALKSFEQKLVKECGVPFKMRVGLNSGPVIVGTVGNDLRMDYTAIGDTVNLASRMQTLARPGSVLVSGSTESMVRDFFQLKPMGQMDVKGKEAAVDAFELMKPLEVETRFEAAVARGLTKFVGRQREMNLLQEAFQKAASGSGQVVGIVGEAGAGKSRLLLEWRATLATEEYAFLEGRCLHHGASMPYLPLVDILGSYFDLKESDREFIVKKKIGDRTAWLGDGARDMMSPLYDILSLTVDDPEYLRLEPLQRRDRIFEAIRNLLLGESQRRPLVLAVEDLHWIDRTSEDFLTYFIDWLASSRMMLIVLYRPEYTHRWGSKSYYSQIGVGQLSTKTSAQLVESILEEGEVVPELSELVLSRASGNPLFLEELTRSLLENGSIQRKDHQYVLTRRAAEIPVPDSLQGIISARMDRLEENLKRTMQVASVIGRDFAFRVLQTITGMQEELKSQLLILQGLEFIYEKSLFPELEYIFKHALTQEVAYNSLLYRRRQELHQKIGQAAEMLYADRLDEFYEMLAYHYSKGENAEKAYHYLRLSGDKAGRRYSNREAFRYYRDAIKILDGMPQTDENKRRGIEVRIAANLPMLALAYPEDSLQVLKDGERLARELADERGLAQICCLIGCCSFFRGDPLEAIRYSESSFEMAEKIGDVAIMASSAFDLGQSYQTTGELNRIAEVLPGVISLIESTGRQAESFGRGFNIYSQLLGQYGQALGTTGSYQQGAALCEKAVRYAEELNDPYSLAFIEFGYGTILLMRGDAKGALAHFLKARELAEHAQITFMLGYIWNQLGWSYYMLRDLPAALEHMEKGLELLIEANNPVLLSASYHGVGMVLCDLGDLTRAKENLQKSLELAVMNSEKMQEGMTRPTLGKVIGKLDATQFAKAESTALEGVRILYGLKLSPLVSQAYMDLAELYRCTGQPAKQQMALAQAFAIPR